ncbi:hypothetical protein V2G26_015143 [Clonostachys chloroleuca]
MTPLLRPMSTNCRVLPRYSLVVGSLIETLGSLPVTGQCGTVRSVLWESRSKWCTFDTIFPEHPTLYCSLIYFTAATK